MIYVLSGGGAGGTLEVTAPAGVTVTATKDGKIKTRIANAQGVAVFKGLSSGTWQLSISDGSQTSPPVSVVIDADYSVTLAFFSATINITYPAGAICTATDGTTTFTAPNTGGTWALTVPNAGMWTIACSTAATGENASDSVVISTDGQSASVTLSYDLVVFSVGTGGENSAVTGGWATYAVTVSSDADKLHFKSYSNSSIKRCAYTNKQIDVTEYNSLQLVCSNKEETGAKIGLTDNVSNLKDKIVGSFKASSDVRVGTINIDISQLSGNLYLQYYVYRATGTTVTATFTDIRLLR